MKVLVYTQQCFRFTFSSLLRSEFWCCTKDHKWCWGLNQVCYIQDKYITSCTISLTLSIHLFLFFLPYLFLLISMTVITNPRLLFCFAYLNALVICCIKYYKVLDGYGRIGEAFLSLARGLQPLSAWQVCRYQGD